MVEPDPPPFAASGQIPLLQYAPPVRGGARLPVWVFFWGLLTSGVTLIGHYLLSRYGGFHLLGWFVFIVVPAGALIVGGLAATGYFFAAHSTGTRGTVRLVVLLFVLQICVYFASLYVEFRWLNLVYAATGRPVPFWDYFHMTVMSIRWESSSGTSQVSTPAAYLFRTLEILAFASGVVSTRMLTSESGYCDVCKVFTKSQRILVLPASPPYPRNPLKMSAEEMAAFREERDGMASEAAEASRLLCEIAVSGERADFVEMLTSLREGERDAKKLPCRVDVHVDACGRCGVGELRASLFQDTGAANRIEPIISREIPRETALFLSNDLRKRKKASE